MDEDDPASRLTQKGVEDPVELRIPIQNVRVRAVDSVETDIALRRLGAEPRGAVLWSGAVDHMRDTADVCEPWREHLSGSDENAGMKVGGRLMQVVWNQHSYLNSGSVAKTDRVSSVTSTGITMNAAKMTEWCAMKTATWQTSDRIEEIEMCTRQLERNIRELKEWTGVVKSVTDLLMVKAEKVRLLEAQREQLLAKTPLRRSARIAARR